MIKRLQLIQGAVHAHSLRVLLALFVFDLLLSSCGSLSPTHSDGRKLPDARDDYYASSEHSLSKSGYLNPWRVGDLAGVCDSVGRTVSSGAVLSDNIFIDWDALFHVDRSNLSERGIATLDKALARINQYEDVQRVELHGLTLRNSANRGNDVKQNISTDSILSYLRLHLDKTISLQVIGTNHNQQNEPLLSEVHNIFNNTPFLKVMASSVKDDASSITLCFPEVVSAKPVDKNNSTETRRGLNLKNRGLFGDSMMLSMGDRVRIRVPEDIDLEGIYEIDSNGNLNVPYVGSINAVGLRVEELEEEVAKRFVEEEILHMDFAMLDISVLQWSVADVFISGAVFNPGRKTINGLKIESKSFKQTQSSGDAARERYLSNALVSAGGVRPDADLSNIVVRRYGKILKVNMEGVLTGDPVPDLSLITGDEVYVPSTGQFREELARVSQITPQGLRLFVSNLSTPRNPNQVDGDAIKLPYGTRLLHVLLSANCVGGTQLTNSAKKALLITVNPLTQQTEIVERNIQQLVSDPDRNHVNPFLMPNDGIACYDSNVTNYRDLARTITDILAPASLLKSLLGY